LASASSGRLALPRSRELTDIEDRHFDLQKQVQYMDDGHSDREEYLSILGANRISRFECLGEPYDIEDSIANLQMAVHLSKDGDPLLLLHHTSHNQVKDCLPSLHTDGRAHLGRAVVFSWRYLSALDGYRTALKILPKVIWLGFSAASRQKSLFEQTQRF